MRQIKISLPLIVLGTSLLMSCQKSFQKNELRKKTEIGHSSADSSSEKLEEKLRTNPFTNFLKEDESFEGLSRDQKWSILFHSNLEGEVGPCGCAINPKGGVNRRLEFVKEMQSGRNVSLRLDTGNSLFPVPVLNKDHFPLAFEKAEAIVQSHKLMKLDAMNVGHYDLAMGLKKLKNLEKDASFPFLSSNLVNRRDDFIFKSSLRYSTPIGEALVLGLTELEDNPNFSLKTLDPLKVVKDHLTKEKNINLLILLSDLEQVDNMELAEWIDFPTVILGSRSKGALSFPLQIGQSLLLQTLSQGQQWGSLDLLANMKSKGIDSFLNVDLMQSFSKKWEQKIAKRRELKNAAKEQKGSEHIRELLNLRESLEAMLPYAPSSSGAISYRYQLHDMDERYNKENELSEILRKLASQESKL